MSTWDITVHSASGQRKFIDEESVGELDFTIQPDGGFGDFTLPVTYDVFDAIVPGDRIDAYFGDIHRYRGYVAEPNSQDDDTGSCSISGYGRSFDLTNYIVVGYYQYGEKIDVSYIFAEMAAEFQKRHTDIVIETSIIGMTAEFIDTNNKTMKQAMDALMQYCGSYATYGFDIDSLGRDRLYIRPIGQRTHTIEVPGEQVSAHEKRLDLAEVKNSVTVEGGPGKYTQLFPNASLEVKRKAIDSNGVGSLLLNGGFEDNNVGAPEYYTDLFAFSDPSRPYIRWYGSNSKAFTNSYVGRKLTITGGTGWITGDYTINNIGAPFTALVGRFGLNNNATDTLSANRSGGLATIYGTDGSDAAWWTFSNTDRRVGELDGINPLTGSFQAAFINSGDYIEQTRLSCGIIPGHNYTFGFWMRPQPEAVQTAGGRPIVLAEVHYLNDAGTEVGYYQYIEEAYPQDWQSYSLVFPAPSGATGFRIRFTHHYGSTGDKRGFLIDNAFFNDNASMLIEGWRLNAYGSAQIITEAAISDVSFAKHGRTCGYLKFNADNANGQDIHLGYNINTSNHDDYEGFSTPIVGGKRYRMSCYQKYRDGWARPPMLYEFRWTRGDGTVIQTDRYNMNAPHPTGDTDWDYIYNIGTAPNDAVSLEAWITFRGDGELYFDCMSLRDEDDPDIDKFLDTGNLVTTFTVKDLFTVADGDIYTSIEDYGLREEKISVSDIQTINDARIVAANRLRFIATLLQTPPITILDWHVKIECGDYLRYIGEHADWYEEGLPVVRVNGKLSETGLSYSLEIQRKEPTEEELYAALASDNNTTNNGSTSQPAASVGGGSGSSTTFYWGTSQRAPGDLTLHDDYAPVDGPHVTDTERTLWNGISSIPAPTPYAWDGVSVLQNANFTIPHGYYSARMNPTSGTLTVTLPDAQTYLGTEIEISNVSQTASVTNKVTIVPMSGDQLRIKSGYDTLDERFDCLRLRAVKTLGSTEGTGVLTETVAVGGGGPAPAVLPAADLYGWELR